MWDSPGRITLDAGDNGPAREEVTTTTDRVKEGRTTVMLSPEARRRAVAPLADALAARIESLGGEIPIAVDGWNRFAVHFALLVQRTLPEVSESAAAGTRTNDFRTIRAIAKQTADFIDALDRSLIPACMFASTFGDPDALGVHRLVGQVADRWLGSLVAGELAPDSVDFERDLLDAAAGLRVEETLAESDLWQKAFAVDESSMLDRHGTFSLPNLLASYQLRPKELMNRLTVFYAPLGTVAMEPTKAIRYAVELLRVDEPVELLSIALHVRRIIHGAYNERRDATVSALSDLLGGVSKSYGNWQRVRKLVESTDWTGDASFKGQRGPEDSQVAGLKYYCKVVEGQIRPWTWTFLRLLTGAGGRQPMLGELRERLASAQDWLAAAFEESIDLRARNAEAHEDFYWDAQQQVLVDGDGVGIAVDELAAKARRGLLLVAGAEFGWALACADLPDMLESIQPDGRSELPSILEVRDALNRIGTNGLLVDGWEQVHDELVVVVRDPVGNSNHAAQALLEVCLWLPQVDRVTFRSADASGVVLTAGRKTLLAMVPGWVEAQRQFERMPTVLFLPVFYQTRLAVQDPLTACDAVVSLALNEAAHFTEAFHMQLTTGVPVEEALAEYSFGLHLTACALEISAGIREGLSDRILGRAYRAMKGARAYADEAVGSSDAGERAGSLLAMSRMMKKLDDLFEAAPHHPPLPPG